MSTWQAPKIDWHPSNEEGVSGEDFNRIEGNTLYLYPAAENAKHRLESSDGVYFLYNNLLQPDAFRGIHDFKLLMVQDTTLERVLNLADVGIIVGGFTSVAIQLYATQSFGGTIYNYYLDVFINRKELSVDKSFGVTLAKSTSDPNDRWNPLNTNKFGVRFVQIGDKVEFILQAGADARTVNAAGRIMVMP